MSILVEAGADPRATDDDGHTAADDARTRGFEDIARLLGSEASTGKPKAHQTGGSELHFAVTMNYPGMVESLLKEGHDPTQVGPDGKSLAETAKSEAVRQLLAKYISETE